MFDAKGKDNSSQSVGEQGMMFCQYVNDSVFGQVINPCAARTTAFE